MPPLQSVVRSRSGSDARAQTPSATRSSRPHGSEATTGKRSWKLCAPAARRADEPSAIRPGGAAAARRTNRRRSIACSGKEGIGRILLDQRDPDNGAPPGQGPAMGRGAEPRPQGPWREPMRAPASTVATFVAATATLACLAPDAGAQTPTHPELQEWEVPYAASRPRDPMVGPDGNVWFVGQVGNYVAMLDPEEGTFERFPLPEGAGPHNLVVDPSGTIWYAGNRAAHIGRLDPETGEVEQFVMPDAAARDPHTLTFDSQGDIWFTVQGGNFIG